MQDKYGEILIVLVAVITILLVLSGVVIFVLLFYQKKRFQHKKEMFQLQTQYSEQLLQSRLEVQENTFAMISQELHDNIGQLLSSTQMLLGVSLRAGADAAQIVVSAQDSLSKALHELRSLSKSLDSEWLNHFNLIDNLQNEKERINGSRALSLSVDTPLEQIPLEAPAQVMLFRIIQEGLQNSVRHSKATAIDLTISQDNNTIHVILSDDGTGFTELAKPKGVGITHMQHRTKLLGGTINWDPIQPHGTCLRIAIPIN